MYSAIFDFPAERRNFLSGVLLSSPVLLASCDLLTFWRWRRCSFAGKQRSGRGLGPVFLLGGLHLRFATQAEHGKRSFSFIYSSYKETDRSELVPPGFQREREQLKDSLPVTDDILKFLSAKVTWAARGTRGTGYLRCLPEERTPLERGRVGSFLVCSVRTFHCRVAWDGTS